MVRVTFEELWQLKKCLETDVDGEIYFSKEMRKAFQNLYNEFLRKNLKDLVITETEKVEILKKNGFEVEAEVEEYLNFLCIPKHLKGYKYLKIGILYSVQDATFAVNRDGRLYPEIAKEYGVKKGSIYRDITTAIENSARGKGKRAYRQIFGNGKVPTNGEFFSIIVERIDMGIPVTVNINK